MADEYDEALLRITARYVEEARAGRQPRLSDYLARYPQHAEAITDFVAYYHALETRAPRSPGVMPSLSERSQVAMQRALNRLSAPTTTHTAASRSRQDSLLRLAHREDVTVAWLAEETGLSLDILRKLETRAIRPATIPYEAVRRIALALRQPLSAVLFYLGEHIPAGRSVAEPAAEYHAQPQGEGDESFRQAVESSADLTSGQRAAWLTLLEHEGL